MKKLVFVSLLGLAAITGFGQPSNAAITYCPSGGTIARTYYYDCATGAYCGQTDSFCFGRPVHTGCTTSCYESFRASCMCPPPGGINP